jgi:predicted peptidase
MRRRLFVWVALLACAFGPLAHARETGFLDRQVVVDGQAAAYQVYVPKAYDPAKPMPVILFLHGAGERGVDGLLQTEVGLPSAIRRNAERYPAIVVLPQAPPQTLWHGRSARAALGALDRTMREFRIDPRRVYLAGLSMGGNGAWNLAYNTPDRFAAMVVICGFVTPRGPLGAIAPPGEADPFAAIARKLAGIPVWIEHGDADPTVSVEESRRMAAALKVAGAQVTYRELPGVGHNSWDPAFRSEGLPKWLFAQRKR